MTRTSPARTLGLLVAGLMLGLLLYLFYFVGGVLTLAGFLVERATTPLPRAETETSLRPVSAELVGFIGEVSLGGLTSIDEESLNRLVASVIAEARLPEEYELHRLRFDLEPAALTASADFTLRSGAEILPGVRLRPISSRVSAVFHAVPGDAGLLLTLQSLKLARISLPMKPLEEYLKGFDIRKAGFPATRVSALSVSIPYSQLGSVLPSAVALVGLEVRRDRLAARLRVDPGLERAVMAEMTPLLAEQGGALREAVAAAFPDSHEELKRGTERLSALADPASMIPAEPSALVSYIENQVRAELPSGAEIIPEIGGDLFSGTVVSTGTASLIEMILRDGSVLKVDENTRFTLELLPASGEKSRGRFALLAGSVRARVEKSLSPDYSFKTSSAVCGVRGTDLVIELDDGRELALSVLEGSVAMIPEGREEILVASDERIVLTEREAAGKSKRLPAAKPLSADERLHLESAMNIRSSAEDAAGIRESRRFWMTLDELKGVITTVVSMDEQEREHLGAELENRLDPAVVDAHFRRMMENPDVRGIIESFGIEGIPYP
jgi:hypothetical protein